MEALVKANRRAIYREFFVIKFLANRRKLEWRMDKVKIQLITMQYQCVRIPWPRAKACDTGS